MSSAHIRQLVRSAQWWLVAAIGGFLPTQLGRHFFPAFSLIGGVRVDYLAPTFYFIDFFLIVLIVSHQQVVGQVLRNRFFQGLVVVLLLNVALSQLPFLSLYWALRTIEAVWIAAIAYRASGSTKQAFWRGSLVGGVFQLGIVLVQLGLQHSVGSVLWLVGERPLATSLPDIAKVTIAGVEYLRPYGTFSHPNAMGGYYALLAVSAWVLIRTLPLRISLVIVSTALVVFSLSRGALAALAIGLGVWAYQRYVQKHRAKMGILALVCLAIGLLVFSRFILSDPLSIQKRTALLEQAGILFLGSPLVGVGRGAYVSAQSAHDFGYAYFFAQPVHSIFMLYLVEMGVVGIAWAAWCAWQMRRQFIRAAPVVVVIIVSGLVDHYWLTLIQNWHLMWVVGGIALSKSKQLQ